MSVDVKSGVISTNLPTESQVKHSSNSSKESSNVKQKTVQDLNPINKNREEKESLEKQTSPAQDRRELQEWVSKMNTTMNEKVQFTYSEDFGGIYVTVVDNETQEVIRKIPTEDAI